MAEIPETAITSAAEAIMAAQNANDGEPERFEARLLARVALEAATPILAEHIAQKITAHMESRGPRKPRGALEPVSDVGRDYRTWRRYFSIAARIAAGAFFTDEDKMRLAAEAIGRGEVAGCNPEVPHRAHRAPEASDRGARIVACPSCGAAAGEMCRTMTQRTPGVPGYEMSTSHADRKRAAVAAHGPYPRLPGELRPEVPGA